MNQNNLTKLLVILFIITVSVAATAGETPSGKSRTIDFEPSELFEFVSNVRSKIDRSTFSSDELIESLDYDESRIISYVTNHIAFEQYAGLLRGVKGVLVSRSGNSLDQSVLLAKLLKDAGYDARIARGELSNNDAELLLSEMTKEQEPESLPLLRDYLTAVAKKYENDPRVVAILEEDNGKDSEPNVLVQASEKAERASGDLIRILGKKDDEEWLDESVSPILEETKDYFWVQYKNEAGGNWIDSHPAFGRSVPNDLLESREFMVDTVNPELVHKFSIQFFIDQKFGSKIKTHALMAPFERPVSNLVGQPLTFNVFSNDIDGFLGSLDADAKIEDFVSGSSIFYPIFNHGSPQGAQLFDLNGNPLPDEALSSYAGVFREINEKTTSAISALTDDNSETPPTSLQRLWYKIVLSKPNGETEQITRIISDRNWSQTNSEFINSITQLNTFSVTAGSYSTSFSIDLILSKVQSLQGIVEIIDGLENAKETVVDTNTDVDSEPRSGEIYELSSIGQVLFNLYSDSLTKAFNSNLNLIQYRSEVNITARHKTILPFETETEFVDILKNTRRSFKYVNGKLETAPGALVHQGILESLIEGPTVLFTNQVSHQDLLRATSKDFLRELTVVKSAADLENTSSLISEDTLGHLEENLTSGFTLILTKSVFEQSENQYWWRVNPRTGETLAMTINKGRYGGGELVTRAQLEAKNKAFIEGLEVTGELLVCTALYGLAKKKAATAAGGAVLLGCGSVAGLNPIGLAICAILAAWVQAIVQASADLRLRYQYTWIRNCMNALRRARGEVPLLPP